MNQKIADIQKILGDVTVDGVWGPKSQASLDRAIAGTEKIIPVEGGVDERSEKNIKTLHPKLQPLARQLIQNGLSNGMLFKITSGTRSFDEQAELRAKYEAGGPKAARPGYSNHNYTLAFDITEFNPSGRPIWDSPNYRRMGGIGKALGLFWGGDWSGGDEDQPHFELRPEWAAHLSETNMIAELRRRHSVGQDYLI